MATMRFDVAAFSFTKTVSAADLSRLNAAAKTHFGMPNATDAQVAAQLAQWVYARIVGLVKGEEQKVTDAANRVADISLT